MKSPDQAWVRCSNNVSPLRGAIPTQVMSGRMLVSTTVRSVGTHIIDAGVTIGIRLLAPVPQSRRAKQTFQVTSVQRRAVPSDQLDGNLGGIRTAGIFRLTAISPDGLPDTTARLWHSRPVLLHFVAEEIWVGKELRPGQAIAIPQLAGRPFAFTWFTLLGNRRIRVGQSRALLLGMPSEGPHAGKWTFDPLNSYGVDRDHDLVVDMLGHATPRRTFADDIRRRMWCLGHLNLALVRGSVRDSTNDAPARGLRIWVQGASLQAVTDSTGSFELAGIPIGIHELCIEGPCGSASRMIEFSDEFTDSLGIRVPFDAIPCGEGVTTRVR